MTERTKNIKNLISGNVDMGTFGLVELELLAIEKEIEELRNTNIISVQEELINYIENDAEIAIPINEMFNENGGHITKKEYGLILLKYLVTELRLKIQKNHV